MNAVVGLTNRGYIRRKFDGRRMFEHVYRAEMALNKPLPRGALVHHVNLDGTDNRNCNLVICPDQEYHKLLHSRTNAVEACGNPEWRPCWICNVYSPLDQLMISNRVVEHKECKNSYQREMARKRRLLK